MKSLAQPNVTSDRVPGACRSRCQRTDRLRLGLAATGGIDLTGITLRAIFKNGFNATKERLSSVGLQPDAAFSWLKNVQDSFPALQHRAGRFLQNQHRVGYTTESYVGMARGGATGVNDLTGCRRKAFGTAG